MGIPRSDTSYQGVSRIDISAVFFKNRKWPISQVPVLNLRHSSDIVRWTISVRDILKKAGKTLKGSEPYLFTWLVV